VENGLFFAVAKTEWKTSDETIIWLRPFMIVSGNMSNDKSRDVKHTASGLCRSGRAQTVATRPNEDPVGRPRLVSDRFRLQGDRRKIANDVVLETFTLPLEAARLEARAIIGDMSQRGYQKIVERWRQLPNGLIEFTMRRLPATD
jgi:hypothetical protein